MQPKVMAEFVTDRLREGAATALSSPRRRHCEHLDGAHARYRELEAKEWERVLAHDVGLLVSAWTAAVWPLVASRVGPACGNRAQHEHEGVHRVEVNQWRLARRDTIAISLHEFGDRGCGEVRETVTGCAARRHIRSDVAIPIVRKTHGDHYSGIHQIQGSTRHSFEKETG